MPKPKNTRKLKEGDDDMTEAMLHRHIKRYGNDAIRYKHKADRCYAAWKEYGNKNDYLNSQSYYKAAERSDSIRKEYEAQLRNMTETDK